MRRAAFILVVAWLLAGCEDDVATVSGRTVKGEDGSGYGPVTVGLLRIENLRYFQHVQTDSSGHFRFEEVPPDDYVPVVTDNARELFHLDQASYRVEAGQTLELTLAMVPNYGALVDYGLALRGIVTDAATGDPLEDALVETTHYGESNESLFSEIFGRSDTVTQLTAADGTFRLWPLFKLVLDPQELGMVPHVRIHKPGYKSTFAGGWRENQVPQNLRVALEPGQDSNVVTGRLVTMAGDPVAGLGVALEWRRAGDIFKDDREPGKMVLPDLVDISDDEGRFRIENVPDGAFVLDPSFVRDDGWVGQQGAVVAVSPTQPEADAGHLIVAQAYVPTFPLDGARLTADDIRFDWTKVEGAVHYQIEFRRRSDGRQFVFNSQDLFWVPTGGEFSVATEYTWLLKALASLTPPVEITRFERPLKFTITESTPGADSTPWQ